MAKTLFASLTLAALLGLLGCGGGAGGGSSPAAASTATLKPSIQGTLPSGAQIGSLDLTLTLPAGVTIKADANGQTLDGIVAPSAAAAGSMAAAAYTPADATHPGKLRIMLIKANGFGTGEFATIKCDLAGPAPAAAAIGLSALAVTDVNSVPIGGLSATLSAVTP